MSTEERTSEIGGYWLSKRDRSPFWQITWFDAASKQTKRVSTRCRDLPQAETKLAEHLILNTQPVTARPEETPLATVFLRYWHEHAKDLPSKDTAKHALGDWNEFWGGAVVSDMSIQKQERFLEWLKAKGYKNSFVSLVISVGRAALRRAWKRQEITAVPYILDESDRSDTEGAPHLTMKELAALIEAACHSTRHQYTFIMIALNTLARPSSILDLSPAQTDFEAGLIDFNPKGRRQTKKRRPIVPMTDAIRPILEPLANQNFYVEWAGEQVGDMLQGFKKVAARAGLSEDVTPYSVRKTVAKYMRSKGVPWEEVKGWLGHKIPGVTEVYAEFDPNYLSIGRQAIDNLIKELGVSLTWHGERRIRQGAAENP